MTKKEFKKAIKEWQQKGYIVVDLIPQAKFAVLQNLSGKTQIVGKHP